MSAHDARLPASALRAVALRYDGPAGAGRHDVPAVVAKGQARVAEAILDLARAHGVPVRSDRDLVALLAACDVGASVPAELYRSVAELILWVQRANERLAPDPSGDAD
ncbi:MAG TPA: EscU/YscU/HrcU family type III secretion system export apparatus switch protein [Planctomycetota bacterium]|nr:EscU/YscU/HrcU family type III secretion system export apparatus switch protein [Planctomycetota bacterium]